METTNFTDYLVLRESVLGGGLGVCRRAQRVPAEYPPVKLAIDLF